MVGWGRDGGIRQVKWFIVFILIKRQTESVSVQENS